MEQKEGVNRTFEVPDSGLMISNMKISDPPEVKRPMFKLNLPVKPGNSDYSQSPPSSVRKKTKNGNKFLILKSNLGITEGQLRTLRAEEDTNINDTILTSQTTSSMFTPKPRCKSEVRNSLSMPKNSPYSFGIQGYRCPKIDFIPRHIKLTKLSNLKRKNF